VRVLIVDDSGDGLLDLALRAKALGHNVLWFLRSFDPVKRPVGRGMIERVPEWQPHTRWADLIIFAANGRYMQDAERLRQEGRFVIGGNPQSAAWELDRIQGMAAFKRAGIAVPAYNTANNLDQAMTIAARHDNGIAIKPSGDVADKSLSFVAKTPAEAIWRLKRWKTQGKRFPHGLILQDRIEGIEFAVGAWFGPDGFVDGWEENFEEKRLFAGALGPNCGEAGTVIRLVRSCKLADKVLKPLEDQLSRLGYVGNVDVNCIVDAEGNPWPLEFTMRFGYPAINIELALHKSDPIEFLACVASGDTPPARQLNTVAVGVVMALPPYPFGHERPEETVNVPIWGITPGIEDNLHFCDVTLGDAPTGGERGAVEPHLATAGSYVLVATGTAQSVVAARREAHRVLERIRIPASPFWRVDIGTRLRAEIPKLQEHGYAKGLDYA
jgi:phosphoribosylamine---glycine ligase